MLRHRECKDEDESLGHQPALQVATDTVEHLKFEAVRRNGLFPRVGNNFPDNRLVVGRNRWIVTAHQ